MKYVKRVLLGLVLVLGIQAVSAAEREQDFNFDWRFKLQDGTNISSTIPLNDADWRDVRLPHDWSVEASFDESLEGCTGYLPGGVAWYQKHFPSPEKMDAKQTYILFDGVYNNATFWLNGELLGGNPYGYSPVCFDLTDLLTKDGSENVISVHVDHSRYADCRWYTGSGIYRNVKLITVDRLHIPVWGTFVTTPEVSAELAVVQVETKIMNARKDNSSFTLLTELFDAEGARVASLRNDIESVPGAEVTLSPMLEVDQPKLWDTETPNMYNAVSTILENGNVVDEYITPFGIRSLRFDKDQGFFLNNKPTYAKGVCLHHDGGLVGAAVPKGVWRRRLAELKEAGCNAIRLSHNPFSQEFLDLCDEMGFLVQNEFFDEWDYAKDKRQNYHDRHDDYITRGYPEHFREWNQSDLTRTMLRDRNHPCVFQWSIGNEIEWTYLHYRYVTGFWEDPNDPQKSGAYWGSLPMHTPEELRNRYEASPKGDYILADTARQLSAWVRELDTTRPVTANLVVPQVSHVSGYADAVDIAGYSYRNIEFGWAKKNFPHKHLTINECGGSWDDWKQVLERPGVFSMYMWTGIDYMGESNGKWPQKAWPGDMLNIAGFRTQGWNYFKSIWVNEPHVSIGTKPLAASDFVEDEFGGAPVGKSDRAYRWADSNEHWNYAADEKVLVEVCSNESTVELFLNGRSLGGRSMSECRDRIFRWVVPFEAGTLTAKSGFDGAEQVAELRTAAEPVRIRLTTDRTELSADGYDVAHVIAQLVDRAGNKVKTSEAKLTFEVDGPVKVLGVDNGSNRSTQDYQSNQLITDEGRGLLLIQSVRQDGDCVVRVHGENLSGSSVRLQVGQEF